MYKKGGALIISLNLSLYVLFVLLFLYYPPHYFLDISRYVFILALNPLETFLETFLETSI